ncbi:MAG: hypothetical protein C5B54_00245, partial [Acidobacteria bacterium]
MRKGLSLLVLFVLLIIGFTVMGGPGTAAPTKKPMKTYDPISVETVPPYEAEEVAQPEATSALIGPKFMPEGEFYDEATEEMLKHQAEFDPRVTHGEDMLQPQAPFKFSVARILFSFNALDVPGTAEDGFFSVPPDTDVAIGPDSVIETVNTTIRFSSRTNTNIQTQTFREHFGVSEKENNFFDPRVLFDKTSGRFVIISGYFDNKPKKSKVYISISKSSSPTSLANPAKNTQAPAAQNWCNYVINTAKDGSWLDYPTLGANENLIAIGGNQFGFSDNRFKYATLHVIDKKVFNNSSACPGATF